MLPKTSLIRQFGLYCVTIVLLAIVLVSINVHSAKVNCRCGAKPWSTKDMSSVEPTKKCCQYFVESGEGNVTQNGRQCEIENEFIYKRFHSCCVSLIQNAYCFQQKLTNPMSNMNHANDNSEEPLRDPWARYRNIFNSPLFG